MPSRYSIADARHNLAAIVHELEHEPVIELTRRGEPVAILLSLGAYRRLCREPGAFWEAYTAFRSLFNVEQLEGITEQFGDVRDPSPGREVNL